MSQFGSEMSPKAPVLKAWFPGQHCSEVGPSGDDWIMRALSSSVEPSIDGVLTNGLINGLFGGVETLGRGTYLK